MPPQITRALIQTDASGHMESEMRDLKEELLERGVPVELFTEKQLTRRKLALAPDILVAGYVSEVQAALHQLKREWTAIDDYPESLRHLLHRSVHVSTVGQIIHNLHNELMAPLFVKPKGRMKRFTGTVFASPSDIMFMEGTSSKTPVYCSEVVRWQSEYRVFVMYGQIVGIQHYAGDPGRTLDEQIVTEAVQTYRMSGEAPAGYGIDFGVLDSGQTALIEVNDGFSLGSYGLPRSIYTDLTISRWCELTGVNA